MRLTARLVIRGIMRLVVCLTMHLTITKREIGTSTMPMLSCASGHIVGCILDWAPRSISDGPQTNGEYMYVLLYLRTDVQDQRDLGPNRWRLG